MAARTPPAFFSAGKHATHHDGGCARSQRLGNIAREADAAIGDQRYARAAEGGGNAIDGHDLRHADTGDDARGADGAWANADLDGVRSGFDQRQRSCPCGNVSANHVDVWVVLLDPAHALDHAMAVTVRGIDHDGVYTGLDQ